MSEALELARYSCHPVEMFEVEIVPSIDNASYLLLALSFKA